jgi:hypothetical protein
MRMNEGQRNWTQGRTINRLVLTGDAAISGKVNPEMPSTKCIHGCYRGKFDSAPNCSLCRSERDWRTAHPEKELIAAD